MVRGAGTVVVGTGVGVFSADILLVVLGVGVVGRGEAASKHGRANELLSPDCCVSLVGSEGCNLGEGIVQKVLLGKIWATRNNDFH